MNPNLLFFDIPTGFTIYNFKSMDLDEINNIIEYVINKEISKEIKPI